jgi:hypothetical protein
MMRLTLADLWNVKSVLSKCLLGIDVATGARSQVKLPLPVSMKRHLRRLNEAIDDEIKIAEPDRTEFIAKWRVYGENKDRMPEPGEEVFEEYSKVYQELFHDRDFVIPFSPFHLELLDSLNEIIPDEIENLMSALNEEYERQSKETDTPEITSAGVSDMAASTANADA